MSTPKQRDLEELSDFQKDALKELGTMGAGHAASALTELIEIPIYMKIPSVKIVKIATIPDLLKSRLPSNAQLAITCASNTQEKHYTVLVLFNKETVTEILSHKEPSEDDIEALLEFSTMYMSLLEEFGSIILIKYITALNLFLDIEDAFPSQPTLRIGVLDSLKEYELKDFSKESRGIFIDCDIYSEDETNIQAQCVLIPHMNTYDRFFDALFDLDD